MTTRPKTLLNIDANAKTVKGQKQGYMTAVLYLAPADLSGHEVCPMATAGCRAACLNTAGRAGIFKAGETSNPIQRARIAKTRWYFEDRAGFMAKLVHEVSAFVVKAERAGLVPCVRLNGTSDIPWERVTATTFETGVVSNIMALFPEVQFYDYTKRANRKDLPANYHLTFSLAEGNDAEALEALANGMNVAAVFHKVPEVMLKTPYGLKPCFQFETSVAPMVRIIDGDASDLRFLDPKGVIVGLRAKGRAKQDTTGFVR